MNKIESSSIISFFNNLNNSGIEYILIRNINYELPDSLKRGKDIDLLVKYEDKKKIYKFLKDSFFKEINHPHRNNVFLYALNKFEFHQNVNGVIIDLNFKIVCRSLDKGQWIPLDQIFQDSCWDNKIYIKQSSKFEYWSLSNEDEYVSLVVRSVFDKKNFEIGYITRIEELSKLVDYKNIRSKFELIFFNYTDFLMSQLDKQCYELILTNYLKFDNY